MGSYRTVWARASVSIRPRKIVQFDNDGDNDGENDDENDGASDGENDG